MIVSDAVGVAFFASILVWNHHSEAHSPEITVLAALAILCTLTFELVYRELSARCTQRPLRDFWSLLQHEMMLLYVLNYLITLHAAKHTVVHLIILEHYGGYINHFAVLMQRNVRDYLGRRERAARLHSDLGMSWPQYAFMANVVSFPHNVLRYHWRWIVLRLRHPHGAAPYDAESVQWCAALVLLWLVLWRRSPAPAWLGKMDVRWYQHWHRWFHEDKLLYRCIHKFHHLFKHPGPLASSTETHMEWSITWAGCHTFCNPFFQLGLFEYEGVNALESKSHDVLTPPFKREDGWSPGYHVAHHLQPDVNFSVPEFDGYYGTMVQRDLDGHGAERHVPRPAVDESENGGGAGKKSAPRRLRRGAKSPRR